MEFKYPWQEREYKRKTAKLSEKSEIKGKGQKILIEVAQEVFNAYIRNRDAALGCITCLAPVEHAGHYLPQGSNSALRFNEVNVNAQCSYCNLYLSGNNIKYRLALIAKYGFEEVEKLESTERFKKWERPELQMIIHLYRPSKHVISR